jgi:hypothetical protein
LIVTIAVALAPACGARVVDLDGDADAGRPVNINSNPDAIAPGVSVFIEDQNTAMKIAVDDKRVYWLEGFGDFFLRPSASSFRSCLKSDCLSTITTYDSRMAPGENDPPSYCVALAAANDNVYWARSAYVATEPFHSIQTCPSTGCVGAPRFTVRSIPRGDSSSSSWMAADESHVYWTSPLDSAVFRLPLSGTGAPEAIAMNETDPDQLVLSGSFAYWIERANNADSTIKRVPKQGGEPAATLAMAQNQATALSADAEFVYWANSYSQGSILRCKVSGCPNGPEVLLANEPWPLALAQDGKSIFWISLLDAPRTANDRQRAAVKRCPIDGCAAAIEVLAVQTFHPLGMSMAVDGSDLYWVAQGPSLGRSFPQATIYRHRN